MWYGIIHSFESANWTEIAVTVDYPYTLPSPVLWCVRCHHPHNASIQLTIKTSYKPTHRCVYSVNDVLNMD